MTSPYIDGTEPDGLPHMAGSTGARLVEISDPAQWRREQRALHDWFQAHAVGGLVPAAAPIDLLARHLGYVHKLQIGRDGTDFQYRIFGGQIASAANIHMQGRWASELMEPTRSLILAHYRDLAATPRLFIGSLVYEGDGVPNSRWYRAVAPIGTPETGVTGFVVMTGPVDDQDPAPAAWSSLPPQEPGSDG